MSSLYLFASHILEQGSNSKKSYLRNTLFTKPCSGLVKLHIYDDFYRNVSFPQKKGPVIFILPQSRHLWKENLPPDFEIIMAL